MATDPAIFSLAVQVGLVIASGLTLLAGYRVIKGPTVPDRVVALDTIATNVVAIAALYALQTGEGLFVTVSLVLAIIGFISTIAVSQYVIEGDIVK
ncbi:multiple resistance and pH regulation protein F [Haladaptatus paucihalophilus DX253]|uniref:Multicomponent Na+:H+ antiporter subunit F n=1 Tax=Haladaptatus paucihalophilus DX253 TaxID=797209 RepID=E7QS18_HALPU|nr:MULTISPECIES: monovalent cation/H+ antiporter complex subunit F [Haladaptatus]EFW92787.1 multiple resistance and pH regulation protein F [Haladaptatus paucihalophilus DX253]GKZ13615.1 Na(+)/H(+) antiporter subunit F [Haladaptatus sp. T7]SHK12608.1 multicomponent Na+:H+ antiporter subunit F [Haladaptatus paucihalophilus DX253]